MSWPSSREIRCATTTSTTTAIETNYNFYFTTIDIPFIRYLGHCYITASEESPLRLYYINMSDKKHSGENVAGITVQIRFVPLKADDDDEVKTAKISVRVDDTQKGTPDNLRELEIPMISKLELEGETFVLNKIKLINTIFHPKGWTKADSLPKRLEKYAMFMENRAKSDFMICQRKARVEFLEFYEFQQKDQAQMTLYKTQQDEFLKWLKEPRTLFKLDYTTSATAESAEVDTAYEEAIVDYENAIMFFCGQKLWKDHRNCFREHKKYYFNNVRKPFDMSIVDFNDRMREYGETLQHLQPSSRKGTKRSADADWNALTSITEEDVRVATFDALPQEYKTHIDGQYEVDFRDMDEIDFLDAMLSYETIDKARRAKLDKEKKKAKEANLKKTSNSRKRSGEEAGNDRAKRPFDYKGRRPAAAERGAPRREKKFCQYCKDNGGKFWTHDTEDCFAKDRTEKSKKEANAMENMQKEMKEMKALLAKVTKKSGSDSESD